MNNRREYKLSSSWTNVGIYGAALLCIIMAPVLYLTAAEQEFHFGLIIGPIIFLLLTGFVIYQFIYASDARIIGDQLVLKKQFRPAKSYSFDKIGYPTSFQLKRTKYITVKMTNEDGSEEKYLIINSNAILAFENKDAQQALISLRNLARKQ